jgi:hypothetical protein
MSFFFAIRCRPYLRSPLWRSATASISGSGPRPGKFCSTTSVLRSRSSSKTTCMEYPSRRSSFTQLWIRYILSSLVYVLPNQPVYQQFVNDVKLMLLDLYVWRKYPLLFLNLGQDSEIKIKNVFLRTSYVFVFPVCLE